MVLDRRSCGYRARCPHCTFLISGALTEKSTLITYHFQPIPVVRPIEAPQRPDRGGGRSHLSWMVDSLDASQTNQPAAWPSFIMSIATFTLKETTARQVHVAPIIDLITIFPFLKIFNYFVFVIATKVSFNRDSLQKPCLNKKTSDYQLDNYILVFYLFLTCKAFHT